MATRSIVDTEIMNDTAAATTALEKADAVELHALFERSVTRYTKMEDVLGKVVEHYVGDKEVPRFTPQNDAIEAMERVALEALRLARTVIEQRLLDHLDIPVTSTLAAEVLKGSVKK